MKKKSSIPWQKVSIVKHNGKRYCLIARIRDTFILTVVWNSTKKKYDCKVNGQSSGKYVNSLKKGKEYFDSHIEVV